MRNRLKSTSLCPANTLITGIGVGCKCDVQKWPLALLAGCSGYFCNQWPALSGIYGGVAIHRMKIPYVKASTPRAQRADNLLRTLLAVHLFGHLRHSELAKLIWPQVLPNSRAVSASRFLSYLVNEDYLLRRLNSLGSYSYVLAQRGAVYVSQILPEGSREGSSIAGIQGRTFFHRTLGTAWMVEQLLAGHDVLPEFAINSNRYEITRTALIQQWGKLPDGLVLHEIRDESGTLLHYNVDWLEVESTHKGVKERGRVIEMGWRLGEQLLDGLPYYLDRLVLLYTEDSNHEVSMVRAAAAKWRASKTINDNPQALLNSIVMVSAATIRPLTVMSYSSIDMLSLVLRSGCAGWFNGLVSSLPEQPAVARYA